MNLMEGFARDQIFIDFEMDPIFDFDQADVSYPRCFATVSFALVGTNGLYEIADRIRKDQGFVPKRPMDEYTEETCDHNGWYEFYIGLNDYNDSKVDTCIQFILSGSSAPDNDEIHTIDLSDYEQEVLYQRLDEQCREYLEKSCAELLRESREQMGEMERLEQQEQTERKDDKH